MTPKRANVRFFPTAAAAQRLGFRACKRCRPDAAPGSPEWNVRSDVVARAMRLIADGLVDREGVSGLARQLGYSERHLTRVMSAELGAGPLAVARAQRAHTARLLVESTDLSITDVAFAAGFGSIRQFNDTVRDVFAATPSQLRAARHRGVSPGSGIVSLRLPTRQPFDATSLFAFLGARAVPGVEHWDGETYRRSLRLPHGEGTVALRADGSGVRALARLEDWRDLAPAVQRCRRLLDLDADPVAVDAALGVDPVLAPLVQATPGRRSPGCVDGAELAVRAVLGQQVSVAGARTLAARLVAAAGDPLDRPDAHVSHLFPSASALVEIDESHLAMPTSRRRALLDLCRGIDRDEITIDPGVDRNELAQRLRTLRGVGPWTAAYIVMRGLGDPDVFLPTDLGVRHACARAGLDASPAGLAQRAERWRPWRSYALHHLWASLAPNAMTSTVHEEHR